MFDRSKIRTLIVATGFGAISLAARAQFTGIYTFDSTWDGDNPYYADYLAQGTDGNLHGTMPQGISAAFYGSWFDYPIGGSLTVHGLTSSLQPENPWAGMTLGIDGNLYGATIHGAVDPTGKPLPYGTLFRISNGVMTRIYSFQGSSSGSYPYAPPIQAPDGNLYGVTYDPAGVGYVYQVLMSNGVGSSGWVHPLPSGSRAGLIMASDGNLYGTVPYGGFTINGQAPNNNSGGGIFQVSLGGVITGVFNFDASSAGNSGATDGILPWGGVIQGADGYLYGAASAGGAYAGGTLYRVALNGTNFSVIHHFQYNDGTAPSGGLMLGSDGWIYGLASANGYIKNIIIFGGGLAFTPEGTLFKTDTTGVNFTRLFTFSKSNLSGGQGSGNNPFATPTLHTNGTIYGLTYGGGTGPSGSCHGCYDNGGEFFSYNPGLPPFISVVSQRNAKVGDRISIIGQGFFSWTTVTFGGTAIGKLGIQVISDNFMTVVVPSGAKTGPVVVQELNGVTLSTPYNFTISCSSLLCMHI